MKTPSRHPKSGPDAAVRRQAEASIKIIAQHLQADNVVQLTKQVELLKQNQQLRKALLFLPLQGEYCPTWETVCDVRLSIFPSARHPREEMERHGLPVPDDDNCPSVGQRLVSLFGADVDGETESNKALRLSLVQNCSYADDLTVLRREAFWISVIGRDRFNGKEPICYTALIARLEIFEKHLWANKGKTSWDEGSVWLDGDPKARNKIILEISAKFADYFADMVVMKNYLDVSINTPAGLSTKAKNKHQQANGKENKDHPLSVEGVDLLSEDGELLGSVLRIRNPTSSGFLNNLIRSQSTAPFMEDHRNPTKDRGLRISSTYHNTDGKPIWVLFGEKNASTVLLSQPANPEEATLIRLTNFVHFCYAHYVNGELAKKYGPSFSRKWGLPGDPEHYDTIVAMVSNPQHTNYARHHDAKPGIVGDDGTNENSRFNLVVPTLVVQNHMAASTTTSFYSNVTNEKVGSLTFNEPEFYLMLAGVNFYSEHEVKNDNQACQSGFNPHMDKKPPGVEKLHYGSLVNNQPTLRGVFSLRKVRHLQQKGLADICQHRHPSRIKTFGSDHHYRFRHFWHGTSEGNGVIQPPRKVGVAADDRKRESGLKVRPDDTDRGPDKADESLTVLDVFPDAAPAEEMVAEVSPLQDLEDALFDPSAGLFSRRENNAGNCLDPNAKSIACRMPMAEFFGTGRVIDECLKRGIAPICKFDRARGGEESCLYGPLLNGLDNRPVAPGTRFPEKVLYGNLGLRHNSHKSATWATDSCRVNQLVFRLPGKNGLLKPEHGEDLSQLSPTDPALDDALAELDRILAGEVRRGMTLYGGGGTVVKIGAKPPSESAEVGGNTAWFESTQKLTAQNLSLANAASDQRIVGASIAGTYLPKSRYCREVGADEQAAYLGLYWLLFDGYDYTKFTVEDLQRMTELHSKRFDKFEAPLLRELLQPRLKWRLVPYALPVACASGLKFIVVSGRDVRRITHTLTGEEDLEDAIGVDPLKAVTLERSTDAFFEGGGWHYFRAPPADLPKVRRVMVKDQAVVERVASDMLFDVSVYEPAEEVGKESINPAARESMLSEFRKRNHSIPGVQATLVRVALANFARTIRVNIDSDGKIGQLIDPPAQAGEGTCVHYPNYKRVFGNNETLRPLSYLGSSCQKSPMQQTCRTYDLNRCVYIGANGGKGGRDVRGGLPHIRDHMERFFDLLFQGLLVEIIPTAGSYVNWARYVRRSATPDSQPESSVGPVLPNRDQVNLFVQSLDRAFLLTDEDPKFWTRIVTGSYEKVEFFHDKEGLQCVLQKLAGVHLTDWATTKLVPKMSSTRRDADIFMDCVSAAGEFIQSLSNGSLSEKTKFMGQHWMGNINEVYSDFPVGIPATVVTGFGSKTGLGMLRELKGMDAQAILRAWVDAYPTMPDSVLRALGYYRRADGVVCIVLNGRPVTMLEAEHGCCADYVHTEKERGGSRSFSKYPKTQNLYQWPVDGFSMDSVESVAKDAAEAFVSMLANGTWKDLVEHGNLIKFRDGQMEFCAAGPIGEGQAERQPAKDVPAALRPLDHPGGLATAAGVARRSSTTSVSEPELDSQSDFPNQESTGGRKRRKLECEIPSAPVVPQSVGYQPQGDIGETIILCIGMVHGRDARSYEECIKLCASGESKTREGRDTARCIKTEGTTGAIVLTLDCLLDNVIGGRDDRHFVCDVNQIGREKEPLRSSFLRLEGKLSEVYLDYCWFCGRYWGDHLTAEFFKSSLPFLSQLLAPGGAMLIPADADLFYRLVSYEEVLAPLYELSFLSEEGTSDLLLVRGTDSINDDDFYKVFGKTPKQQNQRDLVGSTIKGAFQTTEGSHLNLRVLDLFGELSLRDCAHRMIKLTARGNTIERRDKQRWGRGAPAERGG